MHVLSNLRKEIVEMAIKGNAGHIASAFSILEIIYTIYKYILKFNYKNPTWNRRDYFILSKGHGCLALYVVLHYFNFFKKTNLHNFCKPGSILGEHPDSTKIPGVEASTGSLGHGLGFAAGIAYSLKIQKKKNKVFVLLGDGETNEGSVWEALHLIRNLNLTNLIAIIDDNGTTKDVLKIDNLEQKLKAFGFDPIVVDGHNLNSIRKVLSQKSKKLKIILAKTIKGKGVGFMEKNIKWHHRIPNSIERDKIFSELKN
jgi:transketolase